MRTCSGKADWSDFNLQDLSSGRRGLEIQPRGKAPCGERLWSPFTMTAFTICGIFCRELCCALYSTIVTFTLRFFNFCAPHLHSFTRMATKDIDNVGGDTDTKTLQRFIISATKDIQLTLLMTSIQVGDFTSKSSHRVRRDESRSEVEMLFNDPFCFYLCHI